MNVLPTASTLAAYFETAWKMTQSVHLEFPGCVIRLGSTSPELIRVLSDYFAEQVTDPRDADIDILAYEGPAPFADDFPYTVKQPDPGKTKVKEEYVDLPGGRLVHKRLTDVGFLFGRNINVAYGPCLENSNQVVNFINNRFIQRRLEQGCLLGHAAAVSRSGRGVAIAGFSGMGKSTLALSCMSRGADFVSNDRLMVERTTKGLLMDGVAKHPRINPGTALNNPDLAHIVEPEDRERFLALPEADLWGLEHKYDALIHECYAPGRFVLRSPLDALVILNWKRGPEPLCISPAEHDDLFRLLPAFRKEAGLFFLPPKPGTPDPPLTSYVRLFERTPVFELNGGADFEKAALACLEFLDSGTFPTA